MNGIFSKYLSKEPWLIRDKGWTSIDELRAKESLFTLGNGYLGSRGIYEEIPDGTEPGTYIAGVYDQAGAMVTELVNLPNPIDFRIAVEGEKIDIKRMNVLEHERVLDLRNGLIARRTVFSDTRNRRFLYQSLRFFSLHDVHIGAMQIYLTALDKPAGIIVQDAIDDSVTNIGTLLEGRNRHTQLAEVSTEGEVNYLCVKTFVKKIWVAYASLLAVARGKNEEGIATLNKIFNMSLNKNETVSFTKIFSIYTSRHISHKKLKKMTTSKLKRESKFGFEDLLEKHINSWHKKWQKTDVCITGDKEAQKAMRFNIYHLVISGSERDENTSIGARTISGSGYRGHIFWDTEIFMLPFFIYTDPHIARNLLMYRFHRLNQARRIAQEKGYKGVLFPWESADEGREVTPPYAKNLDGTIIEIHTMKREHHIVSDVAYGVWHYFSATEDVQFMLRAGLEIMFETARFWASRVSYNKQSGEYEIKGIIGPDEFHENIDNNAYTNKMAEWNLCKAKEFYEYFNKKYKRFLKKIERKISLKIREVENWPNIANKIKIPFSKSKDIVEEFDGYLRKKDIILKNFDHYFMPVIKDVSLRDIQKTQLVKQADVIMLLYLLPEEFTEEQKLRNYSYYIQRTTHKSSLSPSIHSILASEVGDTTRGYLLFLVSLYADLKNTHGNTGEGIHAANLGGIWQAIIMGFSGFRIMDEMPSFEPRLPGHWKNIEFHLKWKKYLLDITITNTEVKLFINSKDKRDFLLIKCFNSVFKVPVNRSYILYKEKR